MTIFTDFCRSDMEDDHELVADIDTQTLIRSVFFEASTEMKPELKISKPTRYLS